ncbi:hypothetical protein GCM10010464_27750 [Pseudonocardia yunnanensis]
MTMNGSDLTLVDNDLWMSDVLSPAGALRAQTACSGTPRIRSGPERRQPTIGRRGGEVSSTGMSGRWQWFTRGWDGCQQ